MRFPHQSGFVIALAYLGQAEVQNLRLAASRDENIGGLDVAMHDALGVGRVQRVGDFFGQFQYLFQGEMFFAEQMLQRLPLQQFHGDEMLAVGFVDFVNRADVRMVERGGGEGFALEAFAGGGIVFHLGRQKFQRDVAAQLEVLGFVHHTHPAAAQLRQNPVVRNSFADHSRWGEKNFRRFAALTLTHLRLLRRIATTARLT